MTSPCDMLINLMTLPEDAAPADGIRIKRALAYDKEKIITFVRDNFKGWVGETEKAIMQNPSKCFIAVKDQEVVGISCYDATTLGYFGPIGVRSDLRGTGTGRALLLRTLYAMRENGYGYAVAGCVGSAAGFYQKEVGAIFIPGGEPQNTIYSQLIRW